MLRRYRNPVKKWDIVGRADVRACFMRESSGGGGMLRTVNSSTFFLLFFLLFFLCVGSFRERHELGELGGRTRVRAVGAHGQPEERLLLLLLQTQPVFQELPGAKSKKPILLIHFILRENVRKAKRGCSASSLDEFLLGTSGKRCFGSEKQ